MYVCFCSAVASHEIEDAIDDGAQTVDEVGDATGAGTKCGGCHPSIEALLETRGCPRLTAVA